jgi:hypothetical protein
VGVGVYREPPPLSSTPSRIVDNLRVTCVKDFCLKVKLESVYSEYNDEPERFR